MCLTSPGANHALRALVGMILRGSYFKQVCTFAAPQEGGITVYAGSSPRRSAQGRGQCPASSLPRGPSTPAQALPLPRSNPPARARADVTVKRGPVPLWG